MKHLTRFLLTAVLLGVAGCFTFEKAELPAAGGTHLQMYNTGHYLFDCVPLASGNVKEKPFLPFVLFRNDADMDKMQRRFMAEVAKTGGTAHDVTYHMDNSVITMIPILYISVPIPYILTYREMQLSGEIK